MSEKLKIKKGGKYLTRSGHVVVIDHVNKYGHLSGDLFGVRIGNETFDFRVNYVFDDGVFYVPERKSCLDIISDISHEKAPKIIGYRHDGTIIRHKQIMAWQPIETAPKDGSLILVNDTNDGYTPWVAASYVESEEWSGWYYDDIQLVQSNPLGPNPTHWIDVPPVPEGE